MFGRSALKSWALMLVIIAALGFGLIFAPGLAQQQQQQKLTSAYCISCHQKEGADWTGSHHQLANRLINPNDPSATMLIGVRPLIQFLIETQSGNFQASDIAWDPAKGEYFRVFGTEERNPGEWGHWTGQSMNWNSSCARCHMTSFDKNYNESEKRYHSTWVEQGVGCVQCHGPMTDHEKQDQKQPVDNSRIMQTCAACHARAEDLTASIPPGAVFEDHLRLQLVTSPFNYHADGQNISENFEWGSFRHSKMSAAGVTCLDCHAAHTGKLVMPVENNSLCMQCHASGNQRRAPVIDPAAHSFHQQGSPGNSCVSCHMTQKTYMQRHPRRDHGFIIPDPLLNRELGIPDACSSCHADKPLEWNIKSWEKWYGKSGKAAPRRARTRAVARAYDGDVSVLLELLDLLQAEKIPAWRASLLSLADQLAAGSEPVVEAAEKLRKDADPLVRAAAVRALSEHEPSREFVREALRDPVRLVRLDAAVALSQELKAGSDSRKELDEYLNASIENPIALYRRGQDRFRRGLQNEGIADLRRSIELDPLSVPLPEALGYMLNNTGRSSEAAEQFEKAAALAPQDPRLPYLAALAWSEAGDTKQTEKMFRESIRRDPSQARVWYNLGLLLSQTERIGEALRALEAAESAGPNDADIPYATAAILAQSGKRKEAAMALGRALAINPNHEAARELLQRLGLNSPSLHNGNGN